ncbi:hypothetical protein [Aeoliella sp.]|uniref:hypothetical protein n=1 Tax=Aeoliella sp. TaxID=2795800 RepID=UPI003CCC2CDC
MNNSSRIQRFPTPCLLQAVLLCLLANPSCGQDLRPRDFLLDASPYKAEVAGDAQTLTMQNGLVKRVWKLQPNCACVALDNLMTGQALLRSVRPEAKVTIDGVGYDVGGLVGQPNHAYLTDEWIAEMQADPKAMRLTNVEVGKPAERFAWKQRRHHAPNVQWPPAGVYVRFDYRLPTDEQKLQVSVHYELYDGLPAFSKWITVQNNSDREVLVDRFVTEELALVEQTNWVETREGVDIPEPDYLHVETDFAFGGFNPANANRHVVHWRTDPLYSTQVNYLNQTPCLLVVEPTYGPAQKVAPGEQLDSFRVFELVYDDGNRERRGLALRRFYRTLAPWVTENPITHHLLSNDAGRVRQAIDDAAAVGFEAIILSFGSGFNMENRDPQFLQTWRKVAEYAEQQGIELGCYSLFSSRGVAGADMIVSPEGQRPTHGQCPAVTSPWGQQWLATMRSFYKETGFDQFENDGPYPGDVDITSRPPLQQGLQDSRWVQWLHTAQLYRDLRGMGIYINAPDFYYLNGTNKCGMGYREVNWSLPRAHQVIHTRQNIYDGTWTKTPSMGWMFIPLSQYHGGGAAATIEPLDEHQDHYRRMMQSNLGMGVQAHYRGPRLFDSAETKELVEQQVDWFKQHRDILESDIIHGRRADGRDLDWVLHVNPNLETPGMLCVYNPLNHVVTRELTPNLYYTGLADRVVARGADDQPIELSMDDRHRVTLEVTVPAGGMTWYTFEAVAP